MRQTETQMSPVLCGKEAVNAAIWPALYALVLSCYEEEPEPEEHIL